MRSQALAVLLLATALVPAARAQDDEVQRLRAENARLKAQIEALQQAKGAAPFPTPAAGPAAAAPAAPAPTQATATPAPPPAAAPVPVATDAKGVSYPPPPPGYVPPTGYKLVPAVSENDKDFSAPPYDKTGCSHSLLKHPAPAKWNDPSNWEMLTRRMSMPDVEDLIGKDHFDVKQGNQVEWQYGDCGGKVGGFVLFTNGEATAWQVPSL